MAKPKFDVAYLKLLKHFDGKFENYKHWWNAFEEFVDKTDASDSMKCNLLKDYVDDQTRIMISGCSSQNYAEAKKRIKEYYENSYYVQKEVLNRIKSLKTLPNLKDSKLYRQQVGVVEDCYGALKSLNTDQSFFDRLLFPEVTSKFPMKLTEQFIREHQGRQPFEKYLEFLKAKFDQIDFFNDIMKKEQSD